MRSSALSLRDIYTGRVVDYTFNSGTKFEAVRLETKKMQFLYSDGSDFNFMDNATYEQLSIPPRSSATLPSGSRKTTRLRSCTPATS